MQATVNDVQIFGAMVEGMELVSNLITRSTILEKLYLHATAGTNSTAKDQLVKAILELYIAVLRYLSKARHYYDRKTYRAFVYVLFCSPISLLIKGCRTCGIEC